MALPSARLWRAGPSGTLGMERTLTPKVANDRYVAGINWGKDPPPGQHIERLSPKDAETLRCPGRLDRLSSAGGPGARAMLTHPVRGGDEPRLLLTGTPRGLEAMKAAAGTMLGLDGGWKQIGVHPYDTATLRKPTRNTVKELEWMSGCRIVVEDQQKVDLDDPILCRRQHSLYLMGDEAAQGRAQQLLSPRLTHSAVVSDDGGGGAISAFDVASLGENLSSSGDGLIVRRRTGGDIASANADNSKTPLSGCVATGNGQLLPYMQGSFVCLGLRKVCLSRRHVGGTRTGMCVGGSRIGDRTWFAQNAHLGGCRGLVVRPPAQPLPETLLTKPFQSWVFGRGFVRGPNGKTRRLEAANLDELSEGEELGVLISRSEGNVALLRRPDRDAEWSCFVHWAAGVINPLECYLLVELAGAIHEIEFLHGRQPPLEVMRALDEPSPEPRLWP